MKSIDKTLEYHELIMTLDDFSGICVSDLPQGYRIELWNGDDCICDWIRIHMETGEFASPKEAEIIFHMYYDKIYSEVSKRCIFVIDENNVKVATATVSPTDEHGYSCALDWVGVSEYAQGKGIGRALVTRCVRLANELGYGNMILHTQTNTWVAAKLYLDLGFKTFIESDIKGWRVLKTLTNHIELAQLDNLSLNELYDELILNVERQLKKKYTSFNFSVWYIDGHNDVLVNAEGDYHHYKFYENGNVLKIVDENQL